METYSHMKEVCPKVKKTIFSCAASMSLGEYSIFRKTRLEFYGNMTCMLSKKNDSYLYVKPDLDFKKKIRLGHQENTTWTMKQTVMYFIFTRFAIMET